MLMASGSWQDGSQQKKRANFLLSRTLILDRPLECPGHTEDIRLSYITYSLLSPSAGPAMNSVVRNQFIPKTFSTTGLQR